MFLLKVKCPQTWVYRPQWIGEDEPLLSTALCILYPDSWDHLHEPAAQKVLFEVFFGGEPRIKEWATHSTPGESHGQKIWRAAVHGVTKSQTRLRDWTEMNWIISDVEWLLICLLAILSLLWRNAFSSLLFISWLSCLGFFCCCYWVVWDVNIFWRLSPHQLHCLQIFFPIHRLYFHFLWFPLLGKTL